MSVRILAIDTTAEFGSIALAEDGVVVEEVLLHSPEGFGQILFGQIERLLDRHGWSAGDVDCFAGLAGPGSFTGVRIGLTAVKGLAEATGKPAVAISNLRTVAWYGTAPLRATVLDARRGEIYGAVYDAELRAVSEEVVMKLPDWKASLPPGEIEFVSAPRALAGAAACIAGRDFAAGLAVDPAAIDANYVRRADAELLWKDP
jgi:tRNA threonylcarbamoyladenosine biosynthesis protein TsaB